MNNSKAMLIAREYIRDGIAQYEYEKAKQDARLFYSLGDKSRAFYLLRIALFIKRIERVM